MTSPTSELAIRAAALYLPITIVLALCVWRRPDRRRIAAATLAVVWNLVGLLILNIVAQHVGWWTFSASTALVAGMPTDLWIGWALLWGAVPLLATTERLLLTGLALCLADLVLMPMAEPVVSLGPSWLFGEVLGVTTCLVPGLLLGRWTARGVMLRHRVTLQMVAFGGLLFFVLPTVIFTITGENWTELLQRPRWQFLIAALIAAPPIAIALQAVTEFALSGGGTPVPLDPPVWLVVTGPYAYVANPMQLGGTLFLAEWGVLLGSPAVVAASAMAAVFSAGFASWSEARELSDRFGSQWAQYRAEVRAFVPRWRPYTDTAATVFVAETCEPCSEVGRFLANRRPYGLIITPAESSPDKLARITYRSGDGNTEDGLAALGRSVEHINLCWAVGSWISRLPLVRPLLQLVADVVGAGPRQLSPALASASPDESAMQGGSANGTLPVEAN